MKRILEDSDRFIMNTYNRFPVLFIKGRGTTLYTDDGREFLDFVAGIAVNVLGHCHPRVVVAIQKQAQRLIHISNLYHIEPQIRLARLLIQNSFADRVFFCNSGAEAIEAAIKLARKYARDHYGENRYEIITAINSFHGRTLGAVTATGQDKFHKGFEPLVPGFKYVPFNDISALKQAISDKTCAILLEPIQGEGGIRIPSDDYFKEVRKLCDNQGILLILDEVQTGIGRTGRLFAYEHFGIKPDIMTLAKALGGGVPIGAMLATEKIARSFTPGTHASTFGGNPLVTRAALATLETVLEDGILIKECERLGAYFMERLFELKQQYPELVVDVRGKGLMIGMELSKSCAQIVKECFDAGILINCTAERVLRFTPPLVVTEKEIDRVVNTLDEIFGRLS